MHDIGEAKNAQKCAALKLKFTTEMITGYKVTPTLSNTKTLFKLPIKQ